MYLINPSSKVQSINFSSKYQEHAIIPAPNGSVKTEKNENFNIEMELRKSFPDKINKILIKHGIYRVYTFYAKGMMSK